MLPPAPARRDRVSAAIAALAILFGLLAFRWASGPASSPWEAPILMLLAGAFALTAFLLAHPPARRAAQPATPPPDKAAPPPADGADSPPAPPPAPPRAPEERAPWRMSDLQERFSLRRVKSWRLILFGLALMASGFLISRLAVPDRPDYTLEVILWLLSTLLYIVVVAPPVQRSREDWGLWWEINRPVVLVLALIVAVGAVLRLWAIGTIPAVMGGDEGSQGLEAARVLSGELRNPFFGWQGMPTLSFFYNSLGLRLLGQTAEGLRAPWALSGILTILTTFWLVTRLRGLTLGLMTAALLAAFPYHIHFSRLGANNIADPLFLTLVLLFLYRARDRGSPLDWALTGLTMALSFYFYPGARFSLLLVGACLVAMLWERRHSSKEVANLLAGALTLAGAFLIAGAPILDLALRFPDMFNARLNQIGILQNGWLASEPAIRGTSTLSVLADQFIRAALAFNLFPDRTVWFGSPAPLMQGAWAILFLLGLLYATFRLVAVHGDRRLFPFVAWWWGIILTGGLLTDNPPSTARLIGTAPVACFFVALALLEIARSLRPLLAPRQPRGVAALLAVAVAALGLSAALWYFGDFQRTTSYGNRSAVIATHLAHYLGQRQQPGQRIVFLGAPQLYADFPTLRYLEPESASAIDITEPLTAPPSRASLALGDDEQPLFVVMPWRLDELPLIQQGFPSGTAPQFFGDEKDSLYWIYSP